MNEIEQEACRAAWARESVRNLMMSKKSRREAFVEGFAAALEWVRVPKEVRETYGHIERHRPMDQDG